MMHQCYIVLAHTIPVIERKPEVELGFGVSLLGRQRAPVDGFELIYLESGLAFIVKRLRLY